MNSSSHPSGDSQFVLISSPVFFFLPLPLPPGAHRSARAEPPPAKDATRLSLDCASAKLYLARTSSSWHGNHYHPFSPPISLSDAGKPETRMKNKKETRARAPLLRFSSDRESGRRTKNENARRKTQSPPGRLLPPYRNTPARRSVSIVYSDDSGLKWRRVYNRTDGVEYTTLRQERRRAGRVRPFRSGLSHLRGCCHSHYFSLEFQGIASSYGPHCPCQARRIHSQLYGSAEVRARRIAPRCALTITRVLVA